MTSYSHTSESYHKIPFIGPTQTHCMGSNQDTSVYHRYVFVSVVFFPPQPNSIANLSEGIDSPLFDRNKIAPSHRATRLLRYPPNLLISLFYICIASNTFDTVNKEPKAILKQLQSLVFIVYSVYTFSLVFTYIYTYSPWLSSVPVLPSPHKNVSEYFNNNDKKGSNRCRFCVTCTGRPVPLFFLFPAKTTLGCTN